MHLPGVDVSLCAIPRSDPLTGLGPYSVPHSETRQIFFLVLVSMFLSHGNQDMGEGSKMTSSLLGLALTCLDAGFGLTNWKVL